MQEWRYFKKVRRGHGDICLFNSQGQVAFGSVHDRGFLVERIEKVIVPSYRLTVAVGWPENSVVSDLIRSVSELGAETLLFFAAERSQGGKGRTANTLRFQTIAIESQRQCGRARPLNVVTGDWKQLGPFERKWFMDEIPAAGEPNESKAARASGLIVVGCEGGWTSAERDFAKKNRFEIVHFGTPVLTVRTAVICASYYAIERLMPGKPKG